MSSHPAINYASQSFSDLLTRHQRYQLDGMKSYSPARKNHLKCSKLTVLGSASEPIALPTFSLCTLKDTVKKQMRPFSQ